MVYDITNTKSFENLTKWRDGFVEHAAPSDPNTFPFILIGNKIDRESDRQVQSAKAKQWCQQYSDMPYFETSAKENISVEDAFIEIAKMAMKREAESNMLFMPGTIGGAEGAIKMSASDDIRRSMVVSGNQSGKCKC